MAQNVAVTFVFVSVVVNDNTNKPTNNQPPTSHCIPYNELIIILAGIRDAYVHMLFLFRFFSSCYCSCCFVVLLYDTSRGELWWLFCIWTFYFDSCRVYFNLTVAKFPDIFCLLFFSCSFILFCVIWKGIKIQNNTDEMLMSYSGTDFWKSVKFL